VSSMDATSTVSTATAERIVEVNGVDLCVQSFGPGAAEPLLLIAGMASSMLYWDDEFCERLAAGPRFVIRYDLRDTGRSVTGAPGQLNYSAADLLADAIGILDEFGFGRAHLVGLSMGGGLAQLVALEHPQRTASLSLLCTSPAGPFDGPDLPSMSEETMAAFGAVGEPDWTNREAVIDYLVEQERLCAARSHPFDTVGMRAAMGRVFDRANDIRSMTNHFMLAGGAGGRGRPGGITVPTVVLHGDEDPVIPHPHGVALAAEIPGAFLISLPQVGHELPRRAWDIVVPAILRHTAGAGSAVPLRTPPTSPTG
jgi:pimeloyl-ACP methyl ester carboxylesterase